MEPVPPAPASDARRGEGGGLAARAAAWGAPRLPWSWPVDGFVLATLLVATVATRWFHRSTYLWGWDSGLFALGLEDYDVTAARPHPPGYPIYVALGRALLALVGEANLALVLVSIGASAIAVGLLYGFLRSIGSRRAAVAAALLFLLAPVFVFNGVIALAYTLEAAMSVGLAWMAWAVRRGPSLRNAGVLGALWSLGVGIRPSLLFFLSPLVLYALLARPRSPRALASRAAVVGASGAVATLAWFLPMVWATGGFESWRRATALQSEWVVFTDSVFVRGTVGLDDRVERLGFFLSAEPVLLLALLGLLAAGLLLPKPAAGAWREALAWPAGFAAFLAVWLTPSFLFFVLVFDGWGRGPTGYVLVVLPGIYAAFAGLGDACLRRLERAPRVPSLQHAVAWAALPILLLPGPSLVGGWDDFLEKEVSAHDAWAAEWGRLGEYYPPNETAILVWYSWTHVKWYFPEFLVWSYLPVDGREGRDWVLTLETRNHRDDVPYYEAHFRRESPGPHPIPPEIRTIIVFDFQLAGENGGTRRLVEEARVEEGSLDDWRVLFFRPDPATHPTIESYFVDLPDAFDRDA